MVECRRPTPGLPYVEATKARLRWFWTSRRAASLPLHHRRAAAADPTLKFDEDSRSYRLRAEASPSPPLATRRDGAMEGGQKVEDGSGPRPAAAKNKDANMGFQPGTASGAHARGRANGDGT